MENIAVIVYGDGGELGNFKMFADNLKSEISGKYKKVAMQYINRDQDFFNYLLSIDSSKEKIKELHVFSHAIGAALFLGYKDPSLVIQRQALVDAAARANRKVTYHEVLTVEKGAIQTDDFKQKAIASLQADMQNRFSKDAFIKIWGCNSGVSNWVYSDGSVTDPNDASVVYYWRAFNEFNVPKPSVAQAFATFFQRNVWGANSGASIQVKYNNRWISTAQYKKQVGHWPSGKLPHRLVPDKGDYNEFHP